MTVRKRWGKMSLPNQLLVIVGATGVLFTALYTVAALIQLWMMHQSQMQTSEQNEQLIWEWKRMADSMVDSIAQNQSAITAAAEANQRNIEASSAHNRTIVESSIRQSRAALDASIETSRADLRGWLTIDAMRLTVLAADQPLVGEVTIYDRGKTPTLDVVTRGRIQTTYAPYTAADIDALIANDVFHSQGAMFPNTPYYSPFKTDTVLDALSVKRITDGTLLVYIAEEVQYRDIFDRLHSATSCGRYVPSTHRFEYCNGYKNVVN